MGVWIMKYLIVNIIKLKAEGDFVSTEGTYLRIIGIIGVRVKLFLIYYIFQ